MNLFFFFFWALLSCLDMPHDNSFECLIQVLGCCGSEHPHMKFPKTMFFCYLFLFMPWHFAMVPCDQLFSEAELKRQYSGTMCWGLRERGLAQGEMPETCLSGLCMSCGTVCILASTLIWQEGPGAFDLWSLLTSTWQFEAPGKGSVGRACDELSVPQWITAGFALDAGASSERMLEAVPAEPLAGSGFFGWSRDRRNLLFYVETNVPTNLGQQWEFPLQKKNVKESPGWMGGNGILAASLLNVTCIICLERNGKEREVS